ncbi:MAG: DUF3027 domain-containing protein [Actinomycetes bacterium]
MTTTAGRKPAVDAQCASATDLARSALDEVANPDAIGEHLGVEADADRVATHLFACLLPGYAGWRWAVTVARASRGKVVTVDETVLLPGPDSLLAPEWVPWSERLQPGDLGVGDVLPTADDDDRLEPGWNEVDLGSVLDDDGGDGVNGVDSGDSVDGVDRIELSVRYDLGRRRVLSPIGLDDAIDRWLAGDAGPTSPLALAAPATCVTCGFRVAVSGRLGLAFGVCANAYSPSDGHVVSLDHGCGAHSEAAVIPLSQAAAAPVVDELGFDIVAQRAVDVEVVTDSDTGSDTDSDTDTGTDTVSETVSETEADPDEDLGHG